MFPEAPRVRSLAHSGERLYAGVAGAKDEGGAVYGRDAAWRRLTPLMLKIGAIKAIAVEGDRVLVTARSEWRNHMTYEGGAWLSTDAGATWPHLDGPGLQSWNVSALAVDPFDRKSLWVGTGGNSVFVGHLP